MNWPMIQKTQDAIVIRIPWRKPVAQAKKADFGFLIGALSSVPEFQGKSSVEVQHMLTQVWAEKYSS